MDKYSVFEGKHWWCDLGIYNVCVCVCVCVYMYMDKYSVFEGKHWWCDRVRNSDINNIYSDKNRVPKILLCSDFTVQYIYSDFSAQMYSDIDVLRFFFLPREGTVEPP